MGTASLEMIEPETKARRDRPRDTAACALDCAGEEVDWVGLWFKVVEEIAGEYVGMRAGRPAPDGSGIVWEFLPHYSYDGAGGFVHFLRREFPEVSMPAVKKSSAPHRLARALGLLRFLVKKRRPAAPWKRLDRSWRPPAGGAKSAGALATTYTFDKDRTQRIVEKAQDHGVSLNSFLLSAVARASEPELDCGPALWMTPINMRGLVRMKRETANCTAYLHVELDRGVTPAQAHDRVKRALRRGEHWGTWLFLNLGRLVGYKGMCRIYQHQLGRVEGRLCVGVFSNMGNWDGVGQWFVAPPVTYSCPFAVAAITCDGRLSLTIDVHPSIAADSDWVAAAMDRLVAELAV